MHSDIDLIKRGAPTIYIDVNESDVYYFAGNPSQYGHNATRKETTLDEYTVVHKSKEELLKYWGNTLPKTLLIYKVQGFQTGDLLQPVQLNQRTYVAPSGATRNLIISDLENTLSVEPVVAAWPKAPAAAAPEFRVQAKEERESDSLLRTDQRSYRDAKPSRRCC